MGLSSPGRQSILELATPNKNLHIWICLFQLCKVCFGNWGGGYHYYDSTAQTAMQQHVVEHGELDKAQQQSWSSTVSGLSSRCPDTVLPLDPARPGWQSEVDAARLSLTIIQFTAHAILISNTHSQQAHICKSYKSPVAMGERRSSRWGNTGSCSCGTAHRRLGSIWSLSFSEEQL